MLRSKFSSTVCCLLFVALSSSAFGQYNSETIRGYIDEWWQTAVQEMEDYGIPASIGLAQGILESAAGTSELARKANNHFGIKCHNEWTGKKVFYDDDRRNECFRSYRHADDSWKDHSEFLSTRSRYSGLFELRKDDYKGWARGLKKAGYATNPRYADILIKLIDDYELDEYDRKSRRDLISRSNREEKEEIRSYESPGDDFPYTAKDTPFEFNGVPVIYAKAGDYPADIARRHDLSLSDVCSYNEMGPDEGFQEGEKVFLKSKKKKTRTQKYHKVREGETMRDIAQLHGIQVEALYSKNRVSYGFQPAPGENIYLRGRAKYAPRAAKVDPRENQKSTPPPTPKPEKTEERTETRSEKSIEPEVLPFHEQKVKTEEKTYTVRAGDTLYGISRKFDVSVEDIRHWNRLSSNELRIGQDLIIGYQ